METVADIVREMREHASGSAAEAWYTQNEWRKLCKRLEDADSVPTSRGVIITINVIRKAIDKLMAEVLTIYERECKMYNNTKKRGVAK